MRISPVRFGADDVMRSKGSHLINAKQNAVFCYCYHDSCVLSIALSPSRVSPFLYPIPLRERSPDGRLSVPIEADRDTTTIEREVFRFQNENTFLICYYVCSLLFAGHIFYTICSVPLQISSISIVNSRYRGRYRSRRTDIIRFLVLASSTQFVAKRRGRRCKCFVKIV